MRLKSLRFYNQRMRTVHLLPLLGLCLLTPGLHAQEVTRLDFGEARNLLQMRSDLLRANQAETARRTHETESYRSLHGPKVTLDTKQVWGYKTMDMGNISLPPLGGMSIPMDLSRDINGPRASAAIELPIYTGGAISAKIAASEASVAQSRAETRATGLALDLDLAKKYFGVQLADSIEHLRESLLADQEKELAKANRFFAKGVISKLERLSVEVARDQAKRDLLSAKTDAQVARRELTGLLRIDSIPQLSTPLFVASTSIGTLNEWMGKASASNPRIAAALSQRAQAEEGVKAARSAWAPQFYGFANYNFIRHYLSITEPDWIAGVGVKFTLWSNRDRNESLSAARSLVTKAEAGIAETRNVIETAVETAYLRTEQTQYQYSLTLSTLELAKENFRLRQKAFLEGLSSSTELNDARSKLLAAEIGRRVAAYRFVVAWASLNALAGTPESFIESASQPSNFIER